MGDSSPVWIDCSHLQALIFPTSATVTVEASNELLFLQEHICIFRGQIPTLRHLHLHLVIQEGNRMLIRGGISIPKSLKMNAEVPTDSS